jgi:hypothetical protein
MPNDTSYDPESGEILSPSRAPAEMGRMMPLASLKTTEVCTALAKAQGEFDSPKRTKEANIVARDGRAGYKYKYAPLEEIIKVVQKPLAQNGLSRQQYLVSRQGQWFVRTILWHVSEQWLSSDYPIFAEAMTGQKFASGVTYAKRQGLSLVCGLAPEDDDDASVADGAQAVGAPADPPPQRSPAEEAKRSTREIAQRAWKLLKEDIDAAETQVALAVLDPSLSPETRDRRWAQIEADGEVGKNEAVKLGERWAKRWRDKTADLAAQA